MFHIVPNDAVLGTARARLGEAHVEFLRRHAKGLVHMVYDRDETGRKATHRALYALKQVGVRGHDVEYRGGKDPSEVWGRQGTSGMKRSFGLAA